MTAVAGPFDLAHRLRAGEKVATAWSALPDPRIPLAFGRAGFQAITFDMQHGLHDFASVAAAIPVAVAAGAAPIVRVPVGDFSVASRVVDAGAVAVIAPMIDGAETARRFVAHVKYAPVGERSWGPTSAMWLNDIASGADWLARANGATLAFAMIESRASIDALDEILAVEGLDGVFIGPSDLSLALSNGARLAPFVEETWSEVGRIVLAAHRAGRLAGLYTAGAAEARRAFAAGIELVAVGSDAGLLRASATSLLAAVNARADDEGAKPASSGY